MSEQVDLEVIEAADATASPADEQTPAFFMGTVSIYQLMENVVRPIVQWENGRVRSGAVNISSLLSSDPANARRYRAECSNAFSDREADVRIVSNFQSYPELWNEWVEHEALKPHVLNLRRRYEVTI